LEFGSVLQRPRIKRNRSDDGADVALGIDQLERGHRDRINVILSHLEIRHAFCLLILNAVASEQNRHVSAVTMARMVLVRGVGDR
jgi:hypothetical protein